MEDIKKEFTTWLAKYEDFYNPEIGTDDLWIWIEQKIKDAKEEGFQAGCDFTCKQYGDGKTENQIKIEELNEVYGYIDFMDDTLIKYLDKRIKELKEK